MDINERIRQRRKEKKLTQKQIANAVGVSRVSVSQWESGDTSPKGKNLYQLCHVLQCQPDWLLYGKEGSPNNDMNAEWLGSTHFVADDTEPYDDEEVEIPFYEEVELSAGSGSFAVQQSNGRKLRFAKSMLKHSGVSPSYAACVKVSGNSMAPVLLDGATVGVDTANTAIKTIKDGDMYAIDHDGMLRIKRLYRAPGGGMRLKSFNTEEYPDEVYTKNDMKHIRLIGKVFWYSVLI